MNRLNLFVEITLHSKELRDQFMIQFIADSQRNPVAVTKPKYWESMLQILKEYWHRDHFGIQKTKNMRWELPRKREIASGFEAIRLIYEDQFRRLEEERVTHVYHEGCKAHPLKAFATRLLGLGFCDLDNGKYRGYLTPEEQRRREQEDWIPRIRLSPSLESTRLVVGRNHAYNKYGLVGALEERGIRINVVVDYHGIESRINNINL